jgi:DNA repair exonuclease SbcCD nuclease subunit
MPRLAFIYRTDTHVCDRGPVSWKADYPTEIWSNLEQIGRFAKEHDANAVLDGGDYFHLKAASRNPHSLIIKSMGVQKAYPCETWCVEGNHDMQYNDLTSVEEKQPLGVLYEAGTFHHLREQVFEDGGMRVRVVGMPYKVDRSLADLQAIKKQPGDDFLIAVVHQLASPAPPPNVEDFFGEPVFRYSDLVSEDGPDAFCFGHWHKDQGVEEIGGKKFINQGAVSRGALINENTQRTPKVSLIEFTPSGLRVVELPLIVAPAADVFDFEKKQRVEKESESIDQFIVQLQNNVRIDVGASIETNVEQLDFAQDVRSAALEYLARAREGVG